MRMARAHRGASHNRSAQPQPTSKPATVEVVPDAGMPQPVPTRCSAPPRRALQESQRCSCCIANTFAPPPTPRRHLHTTCRAPAWSPWRCTGPANGKRPAGVQDGCRLQQPRCMHGTATMKPTAPVASSHCENGILPKAFLKRALWEAFRRRLRSLWEARRGGAASVRKAFRKRLGSV
jgi:hypothetical protein